MSIEQSVRDEQCVKPNKIVSSDDAAANATPPAIKSVDVAALQIDEAKFVDCDPYNSTGQFITDEIKEQFRD